MSSQDPFIVAVTGNAPFMEFGFNMSLLVRDALPEAIERPGKRDIRIVKFARVTRDTYEDVRRVSREIWSGQRSLCLPAPQPGEKEDHIDVDLILHLGMVAFDWSTAGFRFETVARRDGYELKGDDATSFDVEAAWRKVKEKFPDTSSCVSDDAGLYFCEFRMYSSLVEAILNESYKEKIGRVVFEHIPQAHDPEAIALARDITVTYIAGLADDLIAKKNTQPFNRAGECQLKRPL